MRVLVTGGAGYIGSVVVRRLLTSGHAVRVLDSLLYGGEALLGVYHEDRFSFVQGDIRSAQVVSEALEDVEAVIHLAAIVGDPACARQPALARAVNLEASLQLYELSCRQGVQRFLFASTCSNYGRTSDPSVYLTEESALRPLSLYAETKVAVEQALLGRPAGAPRPATTVLRLATVFGVSPRMRFDLTVNEFTLDMMTKRKVTIYGEQFWRPYIHVRDVGRTVDLVLASPSAKIATQAFNVGDSSQNYQKGTLAELIRTLIGNHAQIEYVEKAEDPRDYKVSFDKIHRELGFTITRTVEDGVQELIGMLSSRVMTEFDNPRYRN